MPSLESKASTDSSDQSALSPEARPNSLPLIAVIGPTGAGKSDVAVALATLLRERTPPILAEIVNADAIQLYKGLDIASARISPSEEKGVTHHLLGTIDPFSSEPITVRDYQHMASSIITGIRAREGVPIITGGTNYYLEGLIFGDATEKKDVESINSEAKLSSTASISPEFPFGDLTNNINLPESERSRIRALIDVLAVENTKQFVTECSHDISKDITDSTTDFTMRPSVTDASGVSETLSAADTRQRAAEDLFAFLREHDAASASVIHPKNTRKVIKAVEFLLEKGTTLSEHQKLVKKKADSTLNKSQSDPVIVIRVDCTCHSDKDDSNRDVHNKRLNDRVEKMLSNGLLDELIDFRNEMRLRAKVIYAEADRHESKSHSGDGVFNIIGLKEFGQFFIDLESCIASTTEKENMPPVMKVVASNILTSLRSESECGISEIELRTGAALEFNHTVHLSDLEQKNLVNQLKSAIEKMKMATKHYAKRQRTWIDQRIIPSCQRENIIVVDINTADKSSVDSQLRETALPALMREIMRLKNNSADVLLADRMDADNKSTASLKKFDTYSDPDRLVRKRQIFECAECHGRSFQGLDQYEVHIASRSHKKRVAAVKAAARNPRWIEKKTSFAAEEVDEVIASTPSS